VSKILWKFQISFNFAQEVLADPTIEQPNVVIFKQMARQHVQECLNMLKPRERTIILYRFGFFDGEIKSLDEIGHMFGLTKERIRQIEHCALQKLKNIASSEGLSAYKMFWS
jgi:RNA polymerase primary sigma factor